MSDDRPIVLIGTPYFGDFKPEYVSALAQTLCTLYGKYKLGLAVAESAQVHLNRNIILSGAHKHNADWLIFIDTDMIWLPEHIETLIRFDKDVCGGVCTTRKVPLSYCVYVDDDKERCKPITEVPKVPFRCFAIGTGFLAIKKSVIRLMWGERHKYGYPFDPIPHGLSESSIKIKTAYQGTDISFCQRLRRAGFDIWCHPDVKPGHIGSTVCMPKGQDRDGR